MLGLPGAAALLIYYMTLGLSGGRGAYGTVLPSFVIERYTGLQQYNITKTKKELQIKKYKTKNATLHYSDII